MRYLKISLILEGRKEDIAVKSTIKFQHAIPYVIHYFLYKIPDLIYLAGRLFWLYVVYMSMLPFP